MDKNKKNEELQSRREFFKNAAKGALPILGMVLLANVPMTTHAADAPMGCARNSCSRQCMDTCRLYCNGTCITNCKNYGCKGYCNK